MVVVGVFLWMLDILVGGFFDTLTLSVKIKTRARQC